MDEKRLDELEQRALSRATHAEMTDLIRLARLGLWAETHRTEIEFALPMVGSSLCEQAFQLMPKTHESEKLRELLGRVEVSAERDIYTLQAEVAQLKAENEQLQSDVLAEHAEAVKQFSEKDDTRDENARLRAA